MARKLVLPSLFVSLILVGCQTTPQKKPCSEAGQWQSLFDGLEAAHQNIVPLSKTMKEEITALQEWATTRARKANAAEEKTATTRRRVQCLTSAQ